MIVMKVFTILVRVLVRLKMLFMSVLTVKLLFCQILSICATCMLFLLF